MTGITAHVVIKHDRDNNTATVFGVFNTVQLATDAIVADLEKTRKGMGARSLRGRLDSVLVDDETDPGVVWVDDLGFGVKSSYMPAVNFSITKTELQETH